MIPTLGHSPFTLQILMRILGAAEEVGEVLLINNSGRGIEIPRHAKFREVVLPSNIFVNPAWNLGAGLASAGCEWLVFLNDDILIPENSFERLAAAPLSGYSLIGTRAESIGPLTRHDDYFQDAVEISGCGSGRNWGFGVCMMVRKADFVPIPDELKIWCGDDFLIDEMGRTGKRVGVMDLQIRTHMSVTADRAEFRGICENDMAAYRRIRGAA
ncbi:glycosyltransferase family 2 protein [Luteolibacter sp. Populi]|uniref:glycosyltransferase family 2 protein n=1 Tax=Luteolibacter sp. Populi TaxID=3230487 RepID=UPI003465141D